MARETAQHKYHRPHQESVDLDLNLSKGLVLLYATHRDLCFRCHTYFGTPDVLRSQRSTVICRTVQVQAKNACSAARLDGRTQQVLSRTSYKLSSQLKRGASALAIQSRNPCLPAKANRCSACDTSREHAPMGCALTPMSIHRVHSQVEYHL